MSQPNLSLKRIADEAELMHSAGYFVDALGHLFHNLGAEASCAVEKVLNGYTIGGIAEGLQIVGTQLMVRAEKLQDLLGKQTREEGAV